MAGLSQQQARQLIAEHTVTVADDCLVQQPLVSAALITFQHRRYLAAALDGVLAQQTDFPFEVVIGDDCSTDGAVDLLRDYQRRHPDKIKLLLAQRNLGAYTGTGRLNLIQVLDACRGKYVALLECDDCWTDPTKLQRQIDLMEQDATIALCHHRVQILDERQNASRLSHYPFHSPRVTLAEVLRRTSNMFYTGSIVFRTAAFPGLPEQFFKLQLADWPLILLLLQSGDAVLVDRDMGLYRQHAGGHWTNKQRAWQNWQLLRMAKVLQRYFAPREQRQFEFLVWSRRFVLGQSLSQTNKWRSRVLRSAAWRQRPILALLKRTKQFVDRYLLGRVYF
jgi:glycosyltransferase involved in cell wall biosynthesis